MRDEAINATFCGHFTKHYRSQMIAVHAKFRDFFSIFCSLFSLNFSSIFIAWLTFKKKNSENIIKSVFKLAENVKIITSMF